MLYLASSSPQRSQILKSASLDFCVLKSNFDESDAKNLKLPPVKLTEKIASDKLVVAVKENENKLKAKDAVFTADTMVFLDELTVYGKPKNESEALRMLRSYSGKFHYVVTAIAGYSCAECKSAVISNVSEVYFTKFSDSDLSFLLKSGEWKNVAGAYRIQGLASFFIERVLGSYTGVLGLPLYEFYSLCKELNVQLDFIPR